MAKVLKKISGSCLSHSMLEKELLNKSVQVDPFNKRINFVFALKIAQIYSKLKNIMFSRQTIESCQVQVEIGLVRVSLSNFKLGSSRVIVSGQTFPALVEMVIMSILERRIALLCLQFMSSTTNCLVTSTLLGLRYTCLK